MKLCSGPGAAVTSLRTLLRAVLAAIAAAVFFAATATAADSMTVTFVRHAESEANRAALIDTKVPGPNLTRDVGRRQAAAVLGKLASYGYDVNAYDGIYASDMVRTQQTAAPMAAALLGKSESDLVISTAPSADIVVLPGVREISAGIFEGQPEAGLGQLGYTLPPTLWTLGARLVPIPAGEDGNEFDGRMDNAIQTIYDSGDRHPVVFSHAATITFWTMMNVKNPDPLIALTHPLGNTAAVVVTGNGATGWTLVNWDGVPVATRPSLPVKLFVDVRDVVVRAQTSIYNLQRALAVGDPAAIAHAVGAGVVGAVRSAIEFPAALVRDIADEFDPTAPTTTTASSAASRSAAAPSGTRAADTGSRSAHSSDTDVVFHTDASSTSTTTSRGPTDLSDGNKAEPGRDGAATKSPAGQGHSTTTGPDVHPAPAQVRQEDDASGQPASSSTGVSGTDRDADRDASRNVAA